MPFDLSSAVGNSSDSSISTTSFDIASAQEVKEPQPGVLQKVARWFAAQTPLQGLSDMSKDYMAIQGKTDEEATQILAKNESDRVNQPLGTILNVPMTGAITMAAVANPIQTIKMVGGFTALSEFVDLRKFAENHVKGMPADFYNISELLDWGLKGAALGGADMFANKIKFNMAMRDAGLPAKSGITPEQINILKETKVFTPEEKSSILNTLDIKPEQIDASINSGEQITIPNEKMLDLAKEPYFDRLKSLFAYEQKPVKPIESVEAKPEPIKLTEDQLLDNLGKVNFDIKSDARMLEVFRRKGMEQETTEIQTRLDENLSKQKDIYKQLSEGRTVQTSAELAMNKEGITPTIAQNKAEMPLESVKPVETTVSMDKAAKEPISSTFKPEEPKPLTGETKTSGLATNIETQAIEKNLVKDLGDLPSYQIRNMADVAKRVSEFIKNDPEMAKKIALREAPEQGDIRAEEMYTGLRTKAVREGDVSTIRELATSEKAATAAAELGQRVKAFDTYNPEDPVQAIKDIAQSREKMSTKRLKTDVKKLHREDVKSLKAEINKVNPKKTELADFIKSLQC